MSKIIWNQESDKLYQLGIDRVVIYDDNYHPWNGVTSITEKSNNSNTYVRYIDGLKHVSETTNSDFSGLIKCFNYPDILTLNSYNAVNNNNNLKQKTFILTYRTKIANQTNSEYGYKVHIVYNSSFKLLTIDYNTISKDTSPSVVTFEVNSTPLQIDNFKNSSHFIVDSTVSTNERLNNLENLLYGTDYSTPRAPSIDELLAFYN